MKNQAQMLVAASMVLVLVALGDHELSV